MKLKASLLVLSALLIMFGNSFTLAVSDTTTGNTESETIPISSTSESGDSYGPVLLSTALDSSFSITKNATLSAAMEASASGDETFEFAIVTEPSHGTITQTVQNGPAFNYNPTKDYVGTDTFTFRLQSGEVYSNFGTITITIKAPEEPIIPFYYTDMQEHWANYSASHLAARGLIIGEEIDEHYYFCPDKEMTRSDFLLFLLSITGNNSSGESNFKFADEDKMPSWLIKNVHLAYNMGIIKGVGSENNVFFYPDKKITRAEAFVMIHNALNAEANVTNTSGDTKLLDDSQIPDWSRNAIKTLFDYKIVIGDTEKKINATGILTRGQGAELCYKLLKEFETQAMNSTTPSGDSTSSGDSTPSGDTTTSGDVTPSGDITASGDITPSGDITTSGDVTPSGDITTSGDITPSGDITASGDITTSGDIITPGDVTSSGDITASGDITF